MKQREPVYDEPAKDIDGNVYKTVKIGNQLWMAENLRTTKYNDGTSIPYVTDDEIWKNLTTGAYCWYDNDPYNGKLYGALYNWYAVNGEKLCPEGWRVPTDNDWAKLTDYIGGEEIAGEKLKATGTLEAGDGMWEGPNEGAINEMGFSALPGGLRSGSGSFHYLGTDGDWWSSTEESSTRAWRRYMSHYYGSVGRNYANKRRGFSLRCLRDID